MRKRKILIVEKDEAYRELRDEYGRGKFIFWITYSKRVTISVPTSIGGYVFKARQHKLPRYKK